MNGNIEFAILWNDNDLFKVRVSACNGLFGGTADVYVPLGGLAEAVAIIEGFPHSASDSRELLLGEFGPKYAGGAISLKLYSKGGAVRCFTHFRIESEHDNEKIADSAQFRARVEPSAIDSFVSELRQLEEQKSGTAKLDIAVSV